MLFFICTVVVVFYLYRRKKQFFFLFIVVEVSGVFVLAEGRARVEDRVQDSELSNLLGRAFGGGSVLLSMGAGTDAMIRKVLGVLRPGDFFGEAAF